MAGQNEPKIARTKNLPVPVAPRTTHQSQNKSLFRYSLPSDFASQLLASKMRLATQRNRRRAPTNVAVQAYDDANQRKIKRVPVGYTQNFDA